MLINRNLLSVQISFCSLPHYYAKIELREACTLRWAVKSRR